jgi:hypothetical protein
MVISYARPEMGDFSNAKKQDTVENAGNDNLSFAVFKPQDLQKLNDLQKLDTPQGQHQADKSSILPSLEIAGAFNKGTMSDADAELILAGMRKKTADPLASAQAHEGEKLWRRSPYKNLTEDGEYGCAASLGVMLKEMGHRFQTSPLAAGLYNNLRDSGWSRSSMNMAQPGDVIFGEKLGRDANKGGGAGHIAMVVGKDSRGNLIVADNNGAEGGVWSIRPLTESFKPERYNMNALKVIRPPRG